MSKKGETALYIFLAFAVVALVGLTYTMLSGQPQGMWGEGLEEQSQCFGTEPGEPRLGQESLGGENLRNCLANWQSGMPDTQASIQECYTCESGGVKQDITADDQSRAGYICEQIGGSEAKITNVVSGLCPY